MIPFNSLKSAALLAAIAVLGGTAVSSCGGGQDDSAALPDANACTPVDSTVCRGKANFHDRALAGLGGNGRACSDCHMDSENFQLTPAAAAIPHTHSGPHPAPGWMADSPRFGASGPTAPQG